ncbi:hypothetical protein QVE09_25575 [Paenibacillus sp. ClWae2A]|uniref:hypothetical protein n=1 Tax=Paenibacillus sp. ClWae2A TaxID=3057177 RepID=UPI0028F57003|nr:hypothetical protein [Paenibacillus sp. ClWae2A]MDT9722285.1 hypothetical protein [Paenibacillus sp. ClWae2A]
MIFSSSDGFIIPNWINHQYSQEKLIPLESFYQVVALMKLADERLLENCQRLMELLEKDTCFGVNVIRFGELRDKSSNRIQILDFWQYGEEEQILYYKGGVWNEKESSIKISEYRHMIEWKPLDKQIKLINLGIKQGRKYTRDAYLLFEIDYNGEHPNIRVNNSLKPNQVTYDKWKRYLTKVVDDIDVMDKIQNLFNKI